VVRRYRLAAVFGPAAVIVAVGIVTVADVRRSADADRWVAHTIEVRETAASALAAVNAGTDPGPALATLRQLTADNIAQQRHLDALALRPSPDSARAILTAIDTEERGLLAVREAAVARWRAITLWVVVLGGAIAAGFAILVNAIVARYAMESARAVADANEARLAAETLVEELRLADVEKIRVEEATRLKSEFLAAMSHELRTPLNAIIGFTQILYDGKVDPATPEHKEYLGDVLTSARHLLQLINDVLDLSKVEAGKMEFHVEPVDLSALIAEVLGILRTTTETKHLSVETHVDPRVTDVVLDAGRFKQVLYNYLSNALKFTPEGGRITIRVLDQGVEFKTEVEDTGPGIPEEDVGRLFTRFEQLETKGRRQPGTGLGLALTKRLVEAQGGEVGVRSTLGRGTTFYAVLPRHSKGIPSSATALSIPGPTAVARKILVVDDDANDQGVLIDTLTKAGYAVETAATGAQALAKTRQQTFDAITLDLLLPDMNGLDVLRAIRSEVANRDVPIIVITVVAVHGAVAGFAVHDFLTKPFDPSALVVSLERAGVGSVGSNVLVVDDDPGSRQLMAATLGPLGYVAHCVPSGAIGLERAREHPPDAVVLDLMMPEMDGFQFLEQFRQLPRCRRIPVIVWTAKNLSVDEFTRLRASAQGVVAKNGNPATTLVEELKTFLPV
jgi:signal transduction histidine kinase/DNA-binding response OmpR family regulator